MYKFYVSIFVFSILLTACGSLDTPQPVGIGREIDEYKRSPCACNEIKQDFSPWLENIG